MDKRTSWEIQKAVFWAMFIRELKTRFGRYRLSYCWALIEPLSHILVLSVMFSVIRERSGFYNIPLPIFFATGIVAYFSFQKLVNVSTASIRSNRGLFGFRQVKPLDAIVVRALLEGGINLTVLVVLAWIGGWFFGFNTLPDQPLKVLAILLLLFFLGMGIGFLTAVVGARYEEAAKFIPTLMRPMYFLSGVFFPLDALPQKYHALLLWNPVLHGVEQFRAAYIVGYPAPSTSAVYIGLWSLSAMLVGLLVFRYNRMQVLMT